MTGFGKTDIGMKRKVNQDSMFCSNDPVGRLPNLYIVADGMGGHNAGDYASRCAIDTMRDFIEGCDQDNPITVLKYAIITANRQVLKDAKNKAELRGMGTTVVCCVIKDGRLFVANMGDSRLYRIGANDIEQVTLDHSLVEELIRSGQIERDRISTHPEKNIITRAVGAQENVVPDFFEIELKEGDRVLLCSDGLYNMVEDDEILDIVNEGHDIETTVDKLIKRANYYGGKDNIGIVLIGE